MFERYTPHARTRPHRRHVELATRTRGETCRCLTAETVQGASLAFQSVDDVHGGDGLPLGVLGVSDGVTDDVLEEHFKHTAGLLVDQTGDTFHAASARQTTDGGLRDTLDVITKYLPVTLGSSFSQTLSSLTAAGHLLSSGVSNNVDSTKWTLVCAHEQRGRLDIFRPRNSPLFIPYPQLSGAG
jgi:hypothetical protein